MTRDARLFLIVLLAAIAALSVCLMVNVFGISAVDLTGYQVAGAFGLFIGLVGLKLL